MFQLTHLHYATIIIDVCAVFLVFGILRQTRFMRRAGRESDRLFLRLLITTVVMAAADIGGYLTIGYANPVAVWVQILSMTLFYAAFTLLSMFWLDYCLFKFKNAQKNRKKGFHPLFLPGVLALAVIVVNVFAGCIFHVDEQGAYHRGFLFIPLYVILAAYIIAGIVMIGRYRICSCPAVFCGGGEPAPALKRFKGTRKSSCLTAGKRKLIPLWLYIMPLAVCILITFVFGEISMAAFGAAVTIAFTHLGTMNEVAEISIEEMTK